MTPNRDLIVSALAAIEHDPDHHDQEHWACGTGMCFGGWVAACAGYTWRVNALQPFVIATLLHSGSLVATGPYPETYIARLLGLESAYVNGRWLFDGSNTLDDLYHLLALALGESEESLRDAVRQMPAPTVTFADAVTMTPAPAAP